MDGEQRDHYARLLAYVIRDDGPFVNAEILRAGLARISARVPLQRLPELKAAERAAQHSRVRHLGWTAVVARGIVSGTASPVRRADMKDLRRERAMDTVRAPRHSFRRTNRRDPNPRARLTKNPWPTHLPILCRACRTSSTCGRVRRHESAVPI